MALTKFVGVTLYWPFLYERNNLSNKYQVDICNLSDAQVEALEDRGVTVRNKGDERGNFLTAKSDKYEIRPYDTNGTELKGITIGNGSKATILFDTFSWKNPAGKKGVSMGIKKLIVTDVVEYSKDATTADEDVLEIL
jgi:hypothetical protein